MSHFYNTFGGIVRKQSLEARQALHRAEAARRRADWERAEKAGLRLKELGFVQDLESVEVAG